MRIDRLRGETEREYTLRALALHDVVAGYERLGQRISAGVARGAAADAGTLDGYVTTEDYRLAVGDFIAGRRARGRCHLPSAR
jgi:hypothetical protein